jgi:hypothetical protein
MEEIFNLFVISIHLSTHMLKLILVTILLLITNFWVEWHHFQLAWTLWGLSLGQPFSSFSQNFELKKTQFQPSMQKIFSWKKSPKIFQTSNKNCCCQIFMMKFALGNREYRRILFGKKKPYKEYSQIWPNLFLYKSSLWLHHKIGKYIYF